MTDLLHLWLPPGERSKIVDYVPAVGGRKPTAVIRHRFLAHGNFPKEFAVCLLLHRRVREFGRMNTQISRIRSIALSCLSVTACATLQLDFLPQRECRVV